MVILKGETETEENNVSFSFAGIWTTSVDTREGVVDEGTVGYSCGCEEPVGMERTGEEEITVADTDDSTFSSFARGFPILSTEPFGTDDNPVDIGDSFGTI